MKANGHASVMLNEVLEGLRPRPGGYAAIDCTVNGGGHSAALLEQSADDGFVFCLDADPSALLVASERLAAFPGRFRLINRNFRQLGALAEEMSLRSVDGILFDLGLSSHQLESSGRGFSLQSDEPLDMRFRPDGGPTAADLLNQLPESEIGRILREFGEEPRARRVAASIVRQREAHPFARTGDLVDAVSRALGTARGRMHPATRVFQALRIAVNDELGALGAGLDAAVRLLAPGGRLVVISFHSLEDRIVKWRFRGWAEETPEQSASLRVLTRKPLTPGDEELHRNPRARSAKLRIAERLPGSVTAAGATS